MEQGVVVASSGTGTGIGRGRGSLVIAGRRNGRRYHQSWRKWEFWRRHFNGERPHSALGNLVRREFAALSETEDWPPKLALRVLEKRRREQPHYMVPKEPRQACPAFWRKSADGQNPPTYGREHRVQLGGRTQFPTAVTYVIPDRVIANAQFIHDSRDFSSPGRLGATPPVPAGSAPGHSPATLPPRSPTVCVGPAFSRGVSCTAPGTTADSSPSV